MPDELSDQIKTNAQGPASASGDSGSMAQHSLPDQIAADRYLESKTAARAASRSGRWPVKNFKIVPPGSV